MDPSQRSHTARHRRVKLALIDEWRRDPYPCPRCRLPMHEPAHLLDAGHDDLDPHRLDPKWLEHPWCNRRAGWVKSQRGKQLNPSRAW